MKDKLILLGLIMTGAVAFSCAGWAGQKSPEKPDAQPQKALIWKDLLQKKAGRPTAAKRDLFSPRVIAGAEDLPLAMPKLKTTLPPEEAPPGETQASPLTLHYIGYSYNKTKQRYVALVFFEEQVTVVQEGDILPIGWKVLKITAKELQVEGLDKKTQTVSREGEQR